MTPPPPPSPMPMGGPAPSMAPPADIRRPFALISAGVTCVPALFMALLAITVPGFVSPMFDRAVTIAGMPFIVPFVLAGLASVGLVVLVALRSRWPWLSVVIAVVLAPIGLFGVLFGPAVVLIIRGLAGS